MDFDPETVPFESLLAEFMKAHDPFGQSWGNQYMNAVFFHDKIQEQAAREAFDAAGQKAGKKVKTALVQYSGFHRAEDYHQKYYLRNDRQLMPAFDRFYPNARDFTDSTAAARVNGLLGGFGDRGRFAALLPDLGLPASAASHLKSRVSR